MDEDSLATVNACLLFVFIAVRGDAPHPQFCFWAWGDAR